MDDPANDTDEQLFARVRRAHSAGDAAAVQRAFLHLQHRHQDRITGHARAKLDHGVVEDLVQVVFVSLFEAALAGKEVTNVRAWLNRVAKFKIADHYRGKEGRRTASLDDPDAAEPFIDGGQDAVETESVIEGLLRALSDVHRRVVELSVLEGRSAREVGAVTGESEANVYQIASRFRTALRAGLDGDNPTGDLT